MKLNLVHITLGMGIGGLEQCIFHLARTLDRNVFRVTVGCLDHGGEFLEQLEEAGHFLEHRKPGLDFGLIFRLAARFRREKVHIVHTHNQAAHFYGGIAARLSGVPVLICTEHSRHHIHGVRRRILEKRVLYRFTDRWVAVSRDLYEASIYVDRLSSKRLSLVPNGIPIPKITHQDREEIRKALGLRQSDRVILMAARLDPVKNHGLMLEALAGVLPKRPDTFLVLAGDGEMRQTLVRKAADLDIGDRVIFLGFRTDVPKLLAASDLFILCSRSEGLPLSLLEAAGAGVPVLVTPGANRAGFVEHGITGRVAEPTPGKMAGEILRMLGGESGLKKTTERARHRVASAYSLEAMTQAYAAIYRDLAREKGVL